MLGIKDITYTQFRLLTKEEFISASSTSKRMRRRELIEKKRKPWIGLIS